MPQNVTGLKVCLQLKKVLRGLNKNKKNKTNPINNSTVKKAISLEIM